eukprot:1068950-Pelagomonas_calceolata.AAC.2
MALAFRKASVAVPTKAGTAPRVAAPRPSVRASRVAMRAEPQVSSLPAGHAEGVRASALCPEVSPSLISTLCARFPPPAQQQSAIEKALQEAEECGDPKSKECAPAWDNVSVLEQWCGEWAGSLSFTALFARSSLLSYAPPHRSHIAALLVCFHAQVEEASAAAAHKKQNETQDPMEKFCEGNEDADECRVYGECCCLVGWLCTYQA